MSTQFFGDVPAPQQHHGSTVRACGMDYEVWCPQCAMVVMREIDPSRALRAATYHNTTFIDRPNKSPQESGSFSWDAWCNSEIKVD